MALEIEACALASGFYQGLLANAVVASAYEGGGPRYLGNTAVV
jgi:hypothetical protein